MTEVKLTPALRFPGFEKEWKSKKLGEFAEFSKGKGISKADINPDGETECIRYGELYTEYSEVIDQVKSRTSVDQKYLVFSEANDVIIPASGETQIDIATASCVKRSGIALGGDLNIIRAKLNGEFLSYYLNYQKKSEIASLAQGNSVVHLYSNQLKTLDINYPLDTEQQKIASFLSAVDNRIQLLKQKKEKLQAYKNGVLQQIFSQQIRFKDEKGNDFPDWEEKKLGDVLKIGSGRDYKHLSPGPIPVYGTGGFMTSVDQYLYDGESVGIGRKGTIDKPVFLTGKFWTVDTLFYTHSFNGIAPYFLFLIFQQINWKQHNEASGVPSLSKATIEKIKISLPSLPEQQKIASFLTSLDKAIEAVQAQTDRSAEFKKGLLQQLFV